MMAAAKGSEDKIMLKNDFDTVKAIIESDMLQNDDDLNSEMTNIVEKIPSEKEPTHQCQFCSKKCLSKGGLTRHVNSKHKGQVNTEEANTACSSVSTSMSNAVNKLEPSELREIFRISIEKLAKDECYPPSVTEQFKLLGNISLEYIMPAFNTMLPILNTVDDTETFYAKFYHLFSDESCDYENLDHNCSLLLSFENVNHVVAHLAGAKIQDDVFTLEDTSSNSFTEKEISLISYLSGYVFSTFYRRIRFSKSGSCSSFYHQQCLTFLLARKCTEEQTSSEHKHIEMLDRGGLWKVTSDVTSIFTIAECYFKCATEKSVTKIDTKSIVSNLMANGKVLTYVTNIRQSSEDPVKKEIALNLLKDLLTLYVRVRAFSFAKDQQIAYKIQQARIKSRSLRTSLKRSHTASNF